MICGAAAPSDANEFPVYCGRDHGHINNHAAFDDGRVILRWDAEPRPLHADIVKANPWQPIRGPIDLAVLGKFGEELGECQAAVSRCIIQGLGGAEPVTGKINQDWLEDEVADVL